MAFLKDFFSIAEATGPITGFWLIFSLILIVSIYRLDVIVPLITPKKSKGKKDISDSIIDGNVITINNSILIYLFEIHSEYKDDLVNLKHSILEKQLSYYETISDKIIEDLCCSYKKLQAEQETLSDVEKVVEYLLFREGLRGIFGMVTLKEFRSSFKKNGFYHMKENDLKNYCSKKADGLLTAMKRQMENFIPLFGSGVSVDMGSSNAHDRLFQVNYFEEKVLDIYTNARDIYLNEYIDKKTALEEKFKSSVNTLMLQNIFEKKVRDDKVF